MCADSHGGRPTVVSYRCLGRALAGATLALLLLLGPTQPVRAATFDQGLDAFQAGNYKQAADIWLELADAGDRQAQYAVGKLYESGQGVPQNYARAAEWYGRAAKQGLAAAQNNLALLYNTGRGVQRNPAEAVRLWQQAAAQGHVQAQYNLGLAYYLGEGVTLNDKEAAHWFLAAAQAGLAEAQFAVGQMNRMGVGMPKDESAALGWYQQAASQGHAEAARKAGELQAAGVAPKAPDLAAASAPPAPAAPLASPPPGATAVAVGGPEVPAPAPAAPPVAAAPAPVAPAPVAPAPAPAVVPQPQVATAPSAEEEEDVPAAAEQGDTSEGSAEVAPQPALSISAIDGAPLVLPPPEKPSAPVQLASAEVLPDAVEETALPPPAAPPGVAAPAPAPTPAPTPAEVTPAPAPAPVQVAMLTPDAKGDSLLWFGSGASEAEAKALAERLYGRFPEVFGERPPTVAKRVEGGKTRWRVEAGPIAAAEGGVLCAALRAVEPNLFCKALPKG